MKRKLFVGIISVFNLVFTFAQDSTRVCEPLHITFHHLQKQNLNINIGGEYNIFTYNKSFYNAVNAQLVVNYLPFAYTEIGYRIKPSFLTYQSTGNKFSLQQNIYLRKHLIFSPCSRYSVFAEGTLHTNNNQVSYKGKEVATGQLYPSLGFGIYKMISPKLQFTFNADLFFGRQPNQASLSLLWNLKNIKFKKENQSTKPFNYVENIKQ